MDGSPAPLPELDLKRLRYFVILAEELHFGRAAQRAFIAQPALSRTIKQLEDQLGVPLFTRSSRHVELTDAGRQLADDARSLLASADAMCERVLRAAEAPASLTVGFFTGDNTLGGAMREFTAVHPETVIAVRRIYWHNQTRAVLDGTVDVALVHLPIDDEGLRFELLHSEPRYAVLAADHPLADAGRVSIHDLQQDPVVLHHGASPAWEAFHNFDPRPDGRAARRGPEVTCLEEKLEVIATGHAISFLPESTASWLKTQSGIASILVTDMPPTEVGVAWSIEREDQVVLDFVSVLRRCGGTPSDAAGPLTPSRTTRLPAAIGV